jgi:hypothetical protein
MQAGDHRRVPVHDAVQHRVQHGLRAVREQLRFALHPPPDGRQVRARAVPDGGETGPDEQMDLAELDRLGLVDVARGAQHYEECLAVPFELRPLVRRDGVVDGQAVQAELLGRGEQLDVRGLLQADPGHRVGPVV